MVVEEMVAEDMVYKKLKVGPLAVLSKEKTKTCGKVLVPEFCFSVPLFSLAILWDFTKLDFLMH